MTANITRLANINGIRYAFANFLVNGVANGASPTALANGADSGSTWLRGMKTLEIAQQAWRTVAQTGDNGSLLWQTLLNPDAGPSGPMTVATADLDFAAKSEGGGVYTDGDWEWFFLSPSNAVLKPFTLIVNAPCQSDDAGSKGEVGYAVFWWFNLQAAPRITAAGMTEATPLNMTYDLIANPVDKWPTGRAFVLGEEGVCDAYGAVAFSPYPVTMHTLVGDGVATGMTLDYTPAAENALKVPAWLDGVKETYTTDYTVTASTKAVTIVVAPTAASKWVTPYQFLTTGIC
jgi:hypothetical protein